MAIVIAIQTFGTFFLKHQLDDLRDERNDLYIKNIDLSRQNDIYRRGLIQSLPAKPKKTRKKKTPEPLTEDVSGDMNRFKDL